ncbi:MAG: acyl-CoA/acyl-ACP dehydrogenase [Thaumarchaeota archaeon]|nr:acyl-CoA/acyl-ACP dehydrogenase [Nitrososphaerota archaeon]
MDFEYDRSVVAKVEAISSEYDEKYWREKCRNSQFPDEYWNSISKAGLFGLMIEEKWGGMGRSLLDLALGTQETAERYSGLGSYLFLSGCLVSTLFAKSSEEQKSKILPKLATGDLKISIALSEEKSGSDSTSLESKALKTSKGFDLSGSKRFVNNVDRADYLIVFARTIPIENSGKKSKGLSMFLVPASSPGIKKKKLDKLGMDFINNFDIEFHGLHVSDDDIVGELDNGWYNAVDSFNLDRVATAASLIGAGRLAVNDAADHSKKRIVFGKALGSNQGIQFPLAEAMAQLITAEALMLKACSLAGKSQNFTNFANLALLEAESAASYATDRALQTFGAHGYYKDYDVERYWRDVRVHKIHPISEELLLSVIAERQLGLPKSF